MRPDKPISFDAEILKQKLLNSEISAEDFIKGIFELDQADSEHDSSRANFDILSSSEVETFFSEHALRPNYYNVRSFTSFHVGQSLAINESNEDNARSLFTSALIAAQEALKDLQGLGYESWVAYVEATVAYFESNSEKMSELLLLIDNTLNQSAIRRLKDGLEKFHGPDYKRDYLQ